MSMRMTAMSLNPVLGSKERALEWVRSMSPKAQYTADADGKVRVSTYSVAIRYISLNFCGFHIACIISLQYQIKFIFLIHMNFLCTLGVQKYSHRFLIMES